MHILGFESTAAVSASLTLLLAYTILLPACVSPLSYGWRKIKHKAAYSPQKLTLTSC